MTDKNKHPANSYSRKKTIGLIFLVIILAVAMATGGFFIAKLITEHNSQSTPTISSQNTDSTTTSKESSLPSASTNSESAEREKVEANPQTPPQYEGENPNNLETLTGAISFIGETNGVFSVRVAIDQAISGSCSLTIDSPNGVTYSDNVTTESGPTSTFCVYTGSAPVTSGTWSVTIKIQSNDGRSGIIKGDTRI